MNVSSGQDHVLRVVLIVEVGNRTQIQTTVKWIQTDPNSNKLDINKAIKWIQRAIKWTVHVIQTTSLLRFVSFVTGTGIR